MTMEQHCKNSQTTPEEVRQRYRKEAERRVRVMLAARAIAEAEQISSSRRRSRRVPPSGRPAGDPRKPRSARC